VIDPRELIQADPLAWRLFWMILEVLPASDDDPEVVQRAVAWWVLHVAACRN
jgi:hypothetical protein